MPRGLPDRGLRSPPWQYYESSGGEAGEAPGDIARPGETCRSLRTCESSAGIDSGPPQASSAWPSWSAMWTREPRARGLLSIGASQGRGLDHRPKPGWEQSPLRGRGPALLSKGGLPAWIFDRTGPPTLALVTCGGSFDRRLRRYADNIVIFAVPV